MEKYTFKSLGHMGEMYDQDGEEAGLPSGTEFYLASDVDALMACVVEGLREYRPAEVAVTSGKQRRDYA